MHRCQACKSAFVDPMPDADTLARFYDAFHLTAADGGWYDATDDRMQLDFPAKIARIRKATGPGPLRLLDVGCGKGYFIKACVEAGGMEVVGVDLSASGVAFARNTLQVDARCGKVEGLKDELGTFDVITFWATIEHLPNPVQVLKNLEGLLRPGGHLFCDTGIGGDWLDRLLPGLAQWYDPPQHLFVFSTQGIIRAMEGAGFTVVDLDPCFERSWLRRILKVTRNGVLAAGFRAVAWSGRMGEGQPFAFTRYPVGNLMSIVAVKQGESVRIGIDTPSQASGTAPAIPVDQAVNQSTKGTM